MSSDADGRRWLPPSVGVWGWNMELSPGGKTEDMSDGRT